MAELLTVGDAARLLDVSVDTMRRWDNDGTFTALRTESRQRRYNRRDVLALKRKRSTVVDPRVTVST